MLNLGPFKSFFFIFYIGNNENPPITEEICWSLDVRYCGASLYLFLMSCGHKRSTQANDVILRSKFSATSLKETFFSYCYLFYFKTCQLSIQSKLRSPEILHCDVMLIVSLFTQIWIDLYERY